MQSTLEHSSAALEHPPTLLDVHMFVGILLAGPVGLKLGATGYRFARYYSGDPAYRRKGRPKLGLRLLLLEPEPGGRFTLDVRGAPIRGRFLELQPPHRLLISWGYAGSDRLPPGASTLEIRLTAQRGGTRVDLEHRDLPADEVSGHTTGWHHYIARLADAATGRDAGADPGMDDPIGGSSAPGGSFGAKWPSANAWQSSRESHSSIAL